MLAVEGFDQLMTPSTTFRRCWLYHLQFRGWADCDLSCLFRRRVSIFSPVVWKTTMHSCRVVVMLQAEDQEPEVVELPAEEEEEEEA